MKVNAGLRVKIPDHLRSKLKLKWEISKLKNQIKILLPKFASGYSLHTT